MIAILKRKGRATRAELKAHTGWLKHTTRGWVSGYLGKMLGETVLAALPSAGPHGTSREHSEGAGLTLDHRPPAHFNLLSRNHSLQFCAEILATRGASLSAVAIFGGKTSTGLVQTNNAG